MSVYTMPLYIFLSIDELQSFGVLPFRDRSQKNSPSNGKKEMKY